MTGLKRIYKILLLGLVISAVLKPCISISYANIIDDVLKAVGLTPKENELITDSNEESNVRFEPSDGVQKEVLDKIYEIVGDIKELDIDSFRENIDYNLNAQDIKNFKFFIENYDNAKSDLISILGTIDINIKDITYDGDSAKAKIDYTYRAYDKLIKNILPEVIIANPKLIVDRNINNDILASVINIAEKELSSGNYEEKTAERDFTFKKVGGEWKLAGIDIIINELNVYKDGIIKNIG